MQTNDVSRRTAYLGAMAAAVMPYAILLPKLASHYLGNPFTDMKITYRHWLGFAVRSVWDGELPLWNPYIFCGQPFMPSTHGTLFYPPNIPFLLLLPQPLSINLCIMTQAIILAAGTVFLARTRGASNLAAMFAGIVASLASLMTCRSFVGHFTIMCTSPWIPVMFGLQEHLFRSRRGAFLPFALAGACMFMGGHLQYAYYYGLFLALAIVLYGVLHVPRGGRARWYLQTAWLHAAAGAVAICLVAIEAVPAIDIAFNSNRGASPSLEWLRHFSLPPENLVTMLAPRFWGYGIEYWGRWEWWEACFYIGIPALVLCLSLICVQFAQRRPSHLAVMFIVMATLAVIGYIPYLAHVMRVVPGWTMFRGHNRPLSFAVAFGAVLAAHAFDLLRQDPRHAVGRAAKWIAALMAATALVLVAVADQGFWRTVLSSAWLKAELFNRNPLSSGALFEKTVYTARLSLLLAAVWSALTLALLLARGRLPERAWQWAVPLLALADLLYFASPKFCFEGSQYNRVPPQTAAFFASAAGRARSGVPNMLNEGTSHRIPSIEGDDIVISKYNNTLVCAYLNSKKIESNFTFFLQGESPVLDAMNMVYVAAPKDSPAVRSGRYVVESRLDDMAICRRPSALPRAYVVGAARWVSNKEESILLALEETDYQTDVVLVGEPQDYPEERFRAVPAEAVTYHGLHETRVVAPRAGWLVLVDGYSPWWKATVDGKPAQVLRANSSFRAVRVKGGETVVFTHRNTPFAAGAWISAVTASLLCAWGVFLAARHMRLRKAGSHAAAA